MTGLKRGPKTGAAHGFNQSCAALIAEITQHPRAKPAAAHRQHNMIRQASQLAFNFNRDTGLTFYYIRIIKGRQEMRAALAAKALRCQKAVIEVIANQFNFDCISTKIWVF